MKAYSTAVSDSDCCTTSTDSDSHACTASVHTPCTATLTCTLHALPHTPRAARHCVPLPLLPHTPCTVSHCVPLPLLPHTPCTVSHCVPLPLLPHTPGIGMQVQFVPRAYTGSGVLHEISLQLRELPGGIIHPPCTTIRDRAVRAE